MKNNKTSPWLFWVKHLMLASIILSVGSYFLYATLPSVEFKSTTNSAALGLSNFYQQIKNSVEAQTNNNKSYIIHFA